MTIDDVAALWRRQRAHFRVAWLLVAANAGLLLFLLATNGRASSGDGDIHGIVVTFVPPLASFAAIVAALASPPRSLLICAAAVVEALGWLVVLSLWIGAIGGLG